MKKIFVKNMFLKVVALFLSIITWMYVSDMVSKEKSFRVPVEIKLSDNMVKMSSNVTNLHLTVKGSTRLIDSLNSKSFRLFKDIRSVVQPGNIIIPVDDLDISLPDRVSVENIFPKRITIQLDRIMEKEFKVEVVTRGKPTTGYVLQKNYRINPAKITLRGPEQIVKNIDKVKTVPIDVSGLIGSKRFYDVRLQEFLEGIPLNKDKYVEVTIRVTEETVKRSYKKIPIRILEPVGLPYDKKVSTSEVEVLLKGREDILGSVTASDIKVFVDVARLEPGVYDLPVEGRLTKNILLEGVTISEIIPSIIEVTIAIKQ